MPVMPAAAGDGAPAGVVGERRRKRRFPIQQPVRYKVFLRNGRIAKQETGHTLNISSKGVYLSTEAALTPGLPIEVAIQWPAVSNPERALRLLVFGRVVRSNGVCAAVAIRHYEFQTMGSGEARIRTACRSDGTPA